MRVAETSAEHMAEMGELVQECMGLALEISDLCFVDRTDLRGLAAAFIARAMQSVDATQLLAQVGLNGDAMSCGRTVVEMAIDFAYIATNPAALIARFVAYDRVHEFRLAKAVDKNGGEVNPALLASMKTWHDDFRDNNPGTATNWAGCPISDRAAGAGRSQLYELSFRDQCNATHSGPGTLAYTVVIVDGEHRLHFGRMKPNTHPILLAYSGMLVLLGDVVDQCGFDRSCARRTLVLSKRVKTLRQYDERAA